VSKLLLLASVSFLLFILPRTDDADTSQLEGRVMSVNKVVIAGAKISARNNFSGKVETAASDTNGWYALTRLQQGRYSTFATAEGYGCVWVFNVYVFRGEHTRLDFTLTESQTQPFAAGCT
jgi:hypothetical protein